MRTILAATWNPRGEESRLIGLLPQLLQVYLVMVIVLPPQTDPDLLLALKESLIFHQAEGRIILVLSPEWSWGRYLALKHSLDQTGEFIHYVDLDRLLRWVEIKPVEWRQTVVELQKWEYRFETLVDPAHYRGTCYIAANWIHLGITTGRGRQDRSHKRQGDAPKEVFVYPLDRH